MTESIRLHVTPSLRAKLKADAEASGAANLNTYLNDLLENRPGPAADRLRRRNPDTTGIERELHRIGNNVNQLSKYRHSTGEPEREAGELRELAAMIRQAIKKVIDL
jgi:hypothetical protein